MNLTLKPLSVHNGIGEYRMLQEIDENENGFTNDVKNMSFAAYQSWLVREADFAKGQNLPENWIPQTTYFLYADNQPIGIARIRHHSCDLLEQRGVGNFGFGIAKPYRGLGYGGPFFRFILEKCRVHGYDRIKSFVEIDNIPSNRIFTGSGAKLLGTFQGMKNVYETVIP